jgi:predicted nucleotidyltransferase
MDALIAKIEQVLAGESDVVLAYLFGSMATGLFTSFSDVDVGVVLKDGTTGYYLERERKLSVALMLKLGMDAVDVTILNAAGPELRHKVISEGELIFCKDEKERVRFEERTMLDYFDNKFLFDEYDEILHQRIMGR